MTFQVIVIKTALKKRNLGCTFFVHNKHEINFNRLSLDRGMKPNYLVHLQFVCGITSGY